MARRRSDAASASNAAAASACGSEVALKVVNNWKPPLLGELPPNFLKINGMPGVKSGGKVIFVPFYSVTRKGMV